MGEVRNPILRSTDVRRGDRNAFLALASGVQAVGITGRAVGIIGRAATEEQGNDGEI